MFSMAYNRRQSLSILLILSMIFSMWMAVAPQKNVANAGILSSVGNIAKSLFISVGGLAGGAMGAVLGAAVGGGPLGMAIGGVAGYFISKKVLKWTTSSVANFATVAGAVAGGFLCAGMGLPMLAIGILGGGIVSRLLVKGIDALIKKIKGSSVFVKKSDLDEETAKAENAEITAYIDSINEKYSNTTTTTTSTTKKQIDSQTAYNNYMEAYNEYVACTSKGDAQGAKAAFKKYEENMELYQSLLKAGL